MSRFYSLCNNCTNSTKNLNIEYMIITYRSTTITKYIVMHSKSQDNFYEICNESVNGREKMSEQRKDRRVGRGELEMVIGDQ